MAETLLTFGETAVSVGVALALLAGLVVVALAAMAWAIARAGSTRQVEAATQALRADEIEERIGEMARLQAETAGRLHTLGEVLTGRQAELARVVAERLDSATHRLGQSMTNSTQHTVESLQKLNERLAVIDRAQKNLTDLSTQVTSLRDVLANKQSRGAFGQARMEAIVRDGLPKGAFEFQYTLSGGRRPDCAVFFPDDPRPLIIDAKFPLEAVTAVRSAQSDAERKLAAQKVRTDVMKHVTDIAEKYLVPGETQDIALMFVPSESVFGELHEEFDDVVQKAYRARVVLVSPALLMLAIQVVQQIQKDARMREAADLIRTEVAHMLDDLGRLRERVNKLSQHFGQANEDVRHILISADKIEKRGTRIEELEFNGGELPDEPAVIPSPLTRKLSAAE